MMIFKEIVYQILFFLYLWTYKKKEPMKLSQQSLSIIESAIQKAVAKYVCNCEQTVVTDIHLQPDQTSGQLNIYNDDDEELANIMIEEWATYGSISSSAADNPNRSTAALNCSSSLLVHTAWQFG